MFASFCLSNSNGELGDKEAAAKDIQKDVLDNKEVELDEYDYVPCCWYAY